MIDFSKDYKVESKLNTGDNIGLTREGISKFPGTFRGMGVEFDQITRRYKTGLDEYAPEVLKLPKEEREEKIKSIIETRTELENLIGSPNILDARNDDFWSVWKVDFEVGDDKRIRVLGSHPNFQPNVFWTHKLALITLEANDYLPKSKKDAGNPKFKSAQFLLTTEEDETLSSKEKVLKSRTRAVEMNKLFGEESNFERAYRIAFLLGVQKEKVGIEKLEEVLEIFSVQPEYIDRFLALCKTPDDELEIQFIVKKAIDTDVIKYNAPDKMYYRGGVNFRETESETIKMFKARMSESVIAREFAEIRAEVDKKIAKAKKK